ncbi:hypothetical protein QQ045_026399 [Rhodiola kirilowii]
MEAVFLELLPRERILRSPEIELIMMWKRWTGQEGYRLESSYKETIVPSIVQFSISYGKQGWISLKKSAASSSLEIP